MLAVAFLIPLLTFSLLVTQTHFGAANSLSDSIFSGLSRMSSALSYGSHHTALLRHAPRHKLPQKARMLPGPEAKDFRTKSNLSDRLKHPYFPYEHRQSIRRQSEWAEKALAKFTDATDPNNLGQAHPQALQKIYRQILGVAPNMQTTNKPAYPFHMGSKVYGSGSFGEVRSGTWYPYPHNIDFNLKVAIKAIPKVMVDQGNHNRPYPTWSIFRDEVRGTLKGYSMSVRRVVRIYDVYLHHPTHWVIIMETANSDLRDLLDQEEEVSKWVPGYQRGHPLPERLVRGLMMPVIAAYMRINEGGLIHRDTKVENLLCFPVPPTPKNPHPFPCFLKIGDFGLARMPGELWGDGWSGTPDFSSWNILNHNYAHQGLGWKATVDVYGIVASIHELLFPQSQYRIRREKNYLERRFPTVLKGRGRISLELIEIFKQVLKISAWNKNPQSFRALWPDFRKWANAQLPSLASSA
ncbi:kinase-like domain-containing protein [Piptocephalis cylindrospora]|uniref:non-specific serine/threonine protein kinase n=1 Tax=Piptocephalis cylindrospora TaxID=1907219 RepID=A0A4P9Y850_9FUNG|nr:kinase-like domain-containing protein [Piptocephalis cylindrospora]|eukprot:RKP15195.1 kinase-like domain-containing protein [Piptocephalis cylindrospora]